MGSSHTSDTMKCSVVKRTKKTNKKKQTINGDASKTQLTLSKLTFLMNQTHNMKRIIIRDNWKLTTEKKKMCTNRRGYE